MCNLFVFDNLFDAFFKQFPFVLLLFFLVFALCVCVFSSLDAPWFLQIGLCFLLCFCIADCLHCLLLDVFCTLLKPIFPQFKNGCTPCVCSRLWATSAALHACLLISSGVSQSKFRMEKLKMERLALRC